MKNLYVIAILSISLTACGSRGGSAESKAIAAPGTPAAPGSSTPAWPLSTALMTETFGAFSCSYLSTGEIKCHSGTTTYHVVGLSNIVPAKMVVGSAAACILVETNGPAADCTTLTDPACTAPATANQVYCWNYFDSAINVDQGTQMGFGAPTYASGPKDISLDGSNNVCIEETSYLSAGSGGAFVQNQTVCAPGVNSLGWIE